MLTAEEKRELELFNDLAENDPESLSEADMARAVMLEEKAKAPSKEDRSRMLPVQESPSRGVLDELAPRGPVVPFSVAGPTATQILAEGSPRQATNQEKVSRSPEKDYLQRQLFPNIVAYRARKTSDEAPVLSLGETAAGLKDLSTLPLRLILPEDSERGIMYTSDNAEGFMQNVAADPTVLPLTVVLGGANLPVKAAGAVSKYGTPARVLAGGAVGAAEGAGGAIASDVVADREISPWGVGLGAASGALLTAPFAAARATRVGHLPTDVGDIAYDASVYRGAARGKGLDEASEKVLRTATDVDKPHPDVIAKAQNQISDALADAEQRAKNLRKSNRITAADFKRGTEGRQAVIDNLMAEDTWLTTEALMREARRVRASDPTLAKNLEDIAVDRLWQATAGRALTATDFSFGFETPLEEVASKQDALFTAALEQTKHLPPPKALLDAQRSGAAASAIYQGLPGGKPAIAGQILEKYLQVPKMAPAAGAAGRTIVPFKKEDVGPQSSLIEIPEGDYLPVQGIQKFV